jgi:hypothetical protein
MSTILFSDNTVFSSEKNLFIPDTAVIKAIEDSKNKPDKEIRKKITDFVSKEEEKFSQKFDALYGYEGGHIKSDLVTLKHIVDSMRSKRWKMPIWQRKDVWPKDIKEGFEHTIRVAYNLIKKYGLSEYVMPSTLIIFRITDLSKDNQEKLANSSVELRTVINLETMQEQEVHPMNIWFINDGGNRIGGVLHFYDIFLEQEGGKDSIEAVQKVNDFFSKVKVNVQLWEYVHPILAQDMYSVLNTVTPLSTFQMGLNVIISALTDTFEEVWAPIIGTPADYNTGSINEVFTLIKERLKITKKKGSEAVRRDELAIFHRWLTSNAALENYKSTSNGTTLDDTCFEWDLRKRLAAIPRHKAKAVAEAFTKFVDKEANMILGIKEATWPAPNTTGIPVTYVYWMLHFAVFCNNNKISVETRRAFLVDLFKMASYYGCSFSSILMKWDIQSKTWYSRSVFQGGNLRTGFVDIAAVAGNKFFFDLGKKAGIGKNVEWINFDEVHKHAPEFRPHVVYKRKNNVPEGYDLSHITPVSWGRKDTRVFPEASSTNRSRGAKLVEEYEVSREVHDIMFNGGVNGTSKNGDEACNTSSTHSLHDGEHSG